MIKELMQNDHYDMLTILKQRFNDNMHRHLNLNWDDVSKKLDERVLKILSAMESSGGEPDVVAYDTEKNVYLFFDCVKESPKERRSLCYDQEALQARKKFKPLDSALNMADKIGITLLDEKQYRHLQTLEAVDTKTSSWLKTPDDIRKLNGAIFGDRRYNSVFIYHNGVESYYADRGFRGFIEV